MIVNGIFCLMGNKREKDKKKNEVVVEMKVPREAGGCGGCLSLYNFRQTCEAFNYVCPCF